MKLNEAVLTATWEKYRTTRDPVAKDRLLIHYIELVHQIAGRMKVTLPSSVQFDDLASCGILGLVRAIENFEIERGNKFETYASQVVRGAMLDGLREYDWLPRTQRIKTRRFENAVHELEARLGRTPEDDEIAAELGIPEEQLRQWLSETGTCALLSLDHEISSSDSDSGSFHEVIPDTEAMDPLESIEGDEVRRIARDLLTELPEQSRTVMALYYFEELTLKEIGQVLGITESRVCQIHGKVILQLRARLINYYDSTKEVPAEAPHRSRGRPRKVPLTVLNVALPTVEIQKSEAA